MIDYGMLSGLFQNPMMGGFPPMGGMPNPSDWDSYSKMMRMHRYGPNLQQPLRDRYAEVPPPPTAQTGGEMSAPVPAGTGGLEPLPNIPTGGMEPAPGFNPVTGGGFQVHPGYGNGPRPIGKPTGNQGTPWMTSAVQPVTGPNIPVAGPAMNPGPTVNKPWVGGAVGSNTLNVPTQLPTAYNSVGGAQGSGMFAQDSLNQFLSQMFGY